MEGVVMLILVAFLGMALLWLGVCLIDVLYWWSSDDTEDKEKE